MPLYEYECEACRERFETIQKFSDPAIEVCPACGGRVRKLLSSSAIQFKGSGWYITDYAKKPAPDTAKTAGADAGKDGTKDGTKEGTKDAASGTTGSASAAKPDDSSSSKGKSKTAGE